MGLCIDFKARVEPAALHCHAQKPGPEETLDPFPEETPGAAFALPSLANLACSLPHSAPRISPRRPQRTVPRRSSRAPVLAPAPPPSLQASHHPPSSPARAPRPRITRTSEHTQTRADLAAGPPRLTPAGAPSPPPALAALSKAPGCLARASNTRH